MQEYKFEYLTGYKSLPTIEYKLVGEKIKRKWWFGYKEEWYIVSSFIKIGPFADKEEAMIMLNVAKCA